MDYWFIWAPLSLVLGTVIGYIGRILIAKFRLKTAEEKVKEILEQAVREGEAKKKELILEAKDSLIEERRQLEKEFKDRSNELQNQQRRLQQKEDNLDRRFEALEKKEKNLENEEQELQAKAAEVQKAYEHHLRELEKVAQMTAEQAKRQLVEEMTEQAKKDSLGLIKKIEEEAKDQAESKAREIIASSIERNAAEVTAEKTITTVTLPNDEMKGRIIGREGRNIRAFESIAGVDLIIDDTPEVVVISSFDPYRREVAKLTLEKLIEDGRIHPARIEEMIVKIQKDVEQDIYELGKQACIQLQISLPRDLYPYIGRMKYRTSYGQNVYSHSIEVANIAGMIAGELKMDVGQAKTAGILHDIGKCIPSAGDGGHAVIGAEVLKKYNIEEIVVNAVSSHHNETEPKFLLASIIIAADSISASRPGARRESFEEYIKRLQALETIATSFDGVDKAFAIQAGREVRIFVNSEKVLDDSALILARDIAKKIEENMKYPGQIKITLIRETRVIEYAK